MNIQGKLINDEEELYDIVITNKWGGVFYHPLMMKQDQCRKHMEKMGISPADIRFDTSSRVEGYLNASNEKEETKRKEAQRLEKLEIMNGTRCRYCRQKKH